MRENWYSGFPTKSDKNRSVQSQNRARLLKIWIWEEEELYYLNISSENKGVDKLSHRCHIQL